MNSGPVKLITVASASGKYCSEAKIKVSDPNMLKPLATCRPGRLVLANVRRLRRVTAKYSINTVSTLTR